MLDLVAVLLLAHHGPLAAMPSNGGPPICAENDIPCKESQGYRGYPGAPPAEAAPDKPKSLTEIPEIPDWAYF
eukprot:g63754.t1